MALMQEKGSIIFKIELQLVCSVLFILRAKMRFGAPSSAYLGPISSPPLGPLSLACSHRRAACTRVYMTEENRSSASALCPFLSASVLTKYCRGGELFAEAISRTLVRNDPRSSSLSLVLRTLRSHLPFNFSSLARTSSFLIHAVLIRSQVESNCHGLMLFFLFIKKRRESKKVRNENEIGRMSSFGFWNIVDYLLFFFFFCGFCVWVADLIM